MAKPLSEKVLTSVVNLTVRNKPHWNIDKTSFIKETERWNIVYTMSAIVSEPLCVKSQFAMWVFFPFARPLCGRGGGLQAAALLFVRRYRQHRFQDGNTWHAWVHFSNFTSCRHSMETLSALLTLCAGNSPTTGAFHPQRACGPLMVSLLFAWVNSWTNSWVSVICCPMTLVDLLIFDYPCIFLWLYDVNMQVDKAIFRLW